MALTSAEKEEIEVLIRKEVKDFFDSSSAKQFEKKLLDKVSEGHQLHGVPDSLSPRRCGVLHIRL